MSVEQSVEWEFTGEAELLRENLPQCHFSTIYPKSLQLRTNPGRHGVKPTTSRLTYGATTKLSKRNDGEFKVFEINLSHSWTRVHWTVGGSGNSIVCLLRTWFPVIAQVLSFLQVLQDNSGIILSNMAWLLTYKYVLTHCKVPSPFFTPRNVTHTQTKIIVVTLTSNNRP
jgi:hypothetical protein